jgi:hypothetical protein
MDEGKFFVNGTEIVIDYDSDISPHLLKELEKSPINQLDVYYLRKRIHQLSSFMSNVTSKTEMRLDDLEHALLIQKQAQLQCQSESIPRIISKQIHDIVNGKFNSIDNTLKNIQAEQKVVAESLMEKISSVANKTLFGAIKNAYIKRPIRTIIVFGVFSIMIFVYVMATLRINSFSQGVEMIMKWFS